MPRNALNIVWENGPIEWLVVSTPAVTNKLASKRLVAMMPLLLEILKIVLQGSRYRVQTYSFVFIQCIAKKI